MADHLIEGFDQCKKYNFLWDIFENNLKITRCHILHNDRDAVDHGLGASRKALKDIVEERVVDIPTLRNLKRLIREGESAFGRGDVKDAETIFEQAETLAYNERLFRVINCVLTSEDLRERLDERMLRKERGGWRGYGNDVK